MKKLLIIALLASGAVSAQIPGYTKVASRYGWIAGAFSDGLNVPTSNGFPVTKPGTYVADGQIMMDTANAKLYIRNAGVWKALTDSVAVAAKTDSVGVVGDSLIVIKNGNRIAYKVAGSGDTVDEGIDIVITGGGTKIVNADTIKVNNKYFRTLPDYYSLLSVNGTGLIDGQKIWVNGRLKADDGGQGSFTWRDTCTAATDDGIIFRPVGTVVGAWIRDIVDKVIDVRWYGAKADGVVQCRAAFQKAINYSYTLPDEYRDIYAPSDSNSINVYLFDSALVINKTLRIRGDGATYDPKTKFYFPVDMDGLVFTFANGEAAIFPELRNVRIRAAQNGTFDNNAHAITTNTKMLIDNVIVEEYDGDGLHIDACANVPSGDNNNYGNSSGLKVTNSMFEQCRIGIYAAGCDANTMLFENVFCNSNRRWGIYDNGMLGNTYFKIHTAFNGVAAAGGTSVVFNAFDSKYYVARPGYDGEFGDAAAIDSNYNKRPDLFPAYWIEVSAMSSVTWNGTTRYYSGGSACIRNSNAWSTFYDPYTEGFQPPIYLNSRSEVIGGDVGSGVTNGIHQYIFGGEKYFGNGNVIFNKNIGNVSNPLAPLDFTAQPNAPGVPMILRSNTTVNFMRMINPTGQWDIGILGGDYQIYKGATHILNYSSTGIDPGAANTFDLGGTNRWKNFRTQTMNASALPSAPGTHAVRWNSATGEFSYGDTTTALTSGSVASPTGTAVSNVDAVTVGEMQWTRVGNIITFSFSADVDATATGGATFDIDLPVASNFSSSTQGNGTCNEKAAGGTAAMGGYIEVNATTDKIRVTVTARGTSGVVYTGTGQYRVI